MMRSRLSYILLGVWLLCLPAVLRAGLAPTGTEFQVNTYTTGFQDMPSASASAAGDFVVTWSSTAQDGDGRGIFAQRFDSSGVSTGTEFQVNTYTVGYQFVPAVAVARTSGSFVVAWTSVGQDGDAAGVFGQRFASDGTPAGTEFQVNTFTTFVQGFSDVAAFADGSFVVVWQSERQAGIIGQRFASSGARVGTEFLINTYTPEAQLFATVAGGADGEFVVAWRSDNQDGDNAGIFGQRFASDGSAAGSEFQVNTFTPGYQSTPKIAVLDNSDFVIVWRGDYQDGSFSGVFGRRFSSGGMVLGTEFLVNSTTFGFQLNPDVAAGPNNFVVTWQGLDQYGGGIFAKGYANGGTTIASEFRVNTYTPFNQYSPTIAALAAGDFVVAWQSYSQDGANDGIFAQRLAPAQPAAAAPMLSPGGVIFAAAALLAIGTFRLVRKPRDGRDSID